MKYSVMQKKDKNENKNENKFENNVAANKNEKWVWRIQKPVGRKLSLDS